MTTIGWTLTAIGGHLIERGQSCFKRDLDHPRVSRRERVLGDQVTVGPHGRGVRRINAIDLGDQRISELGRLFRLEDRPRSSGRWFTSGRDNHRRPIAVSASVRSRPLLRFGALGKLGDGSAKIGRIEIVLPGNSNQSEQGIAARIG